MRTDEFEAAIGIYLGGDPNDGGIQIGGGNQRLIDRYGADAPFVSAELDRLLKRCLAELPAGFTRDGEAIATWLARHLPNLSVECRGKITSWVLYHVQH